MEVSIIEKLDHSNYATWVNDIRVVLMEKNCWRIVSGEEKQPVAKTETAAADASATEATATDKTVSEKSVRDFTMRQDRAYSTIYLNISKEYRALITDTQDPKVAFKRLEDHFQPKSRARIVGLNDDFFSCRINSDEEIGVFAARLKKIGADLAKVDNPIPDWYKSFQLIRFLPHDFDPIVQSIYRWEDPEFTFDKIQEALIAEESRLKQSRKDQEISVYHLNKNAREQHHPSTSASRTKPENSQKTRRSRPRNRRNPSQASRQRTPSSRRRSKPETSFVVEALSSEPQQNREWIFDTAASAHFCSNKDLITDFEALDNTTMSVAIGGVTCPVEGRGTVRLEFQNRGESEIIKLQNVLYSPKLRQNLISGSLVDNSNAYFVGKNNKITVYHNDGRVLFEAYKKRGLYFAKPYYGNNVKSDSNTKSKVNFSTSSENTLDVWHKRYCHVNSKYIVQTSKNNCVKGLPVFKNQIIKCDPCKLSKTRRKSFKPLGKIRSNKPLELIHMDLCGPLPDVAIGGFRYFLTIIDDFSRKVTTYPLKEKRGVFSCFTSYQKRVERFLNRKILNVRTDNGLEFCSNEFEDFLDDQGIKMERTNTYTPEQNGVSERFNYTAVNAIKAMLKDSGLGNNFWAEALFCFTYVWNRICHGNQKQTPFQLFGGNQPSVKHLKTFGTPVYLGIPKQLRKKLDMRTKKGIMVGYAQRTRGYRIWLPNERKIVESINVTFDDETTSSGARLEPNHEKFRAASYQSDSESETNSDVQSDNESIHEPSSKIESKEPIPGNVEHIPPAPIKKVIWSREAVTRPDGTRTDIYYRIEGSNARLRSHKDVEVYCNSNNIPYDKNRFNFSGKNTYSGKVNEESNIINA